MNRISKCVHSLLEKLSNYPILGSENTNILDNLVALLLVLSPLLQHYKGFIVNAGILVLVICLPYVCLKLLFRIRSLPLKNVLVAIPLVLFQIFRVVAHGTTFMEFAHGAVLCGYFVAIALGGINLKYVARWAYLVAMAAGIGIIVQCICYYGFDFHLQLVATDLLLEESHAWVKLAQTGIIGVTGTASSFYRPSAFFLEPSHMFLYYIPNLFLLMLTKEMNWLKRISSVILSAGLVLSTSGMGIALVVGVWLLQLGFGKGKENVLRIKHLFCKQNILRCIAFALVFLVIVFTLPFLRYSILRIFIGGTAVKAMIAAEEAEKAAEKAQIALQNQQTQKATEFVFDTEEPGEKTNETATDVVVEPSTEVAEEVVTEVPTEMPSNASTEPSTEVTTEIETQVADVPTEALTEMESQTEETIDAVAEAEKLAQEKAEAASEAERLAQENAGSTAISGRTERAISLIRYKMSGSQYLAGVSDSTENVDFNLPGFFSTMYRYGIIGTLLSYIFYISCALFGKGANRWMAIIILGVSFFSAHTHGTFYMLFYVLLLMDGLITKSVKDSE